MKKIYNKLFLMVVSVACCSNIAFAMEKKKLIAQNRINIIKNHLKSCDNTIKEKNKQIILKNLCADSIFSLFSTETDPLRHLKSLPWSIDPAKVYSSIFDKNQKIDSNSPPVILAMSDWQDQSYILSYYGKIFWDYKLYLFNCNAHCNVEHQNASKKIQYTAFGQEYDAQALLVTLLAYYEKGLQKIYALGEGSGGTAWITVLSMVSEPFKYESWWKQLGVIKNNALDLEKINSIKKMAQNGLVYLAYPLLDMKHYFEHIDKTLSFDSKEFLKYGKFSLNNESPYLLLKKLIEKNEFTIILDLPQKNEIAGNNYDEMFKKLENKKFKILTNQSLFYKDYPSMINGALEMYLQDLEKDTKSTMNDPARYLKNLPWDIDPSHVYYNFLLNKNVEEYAWKPTTIVVFQGYELEPYLLAVDSAAKQYWDTYKLYMVHVNPHSSVVHNDVSEKKKYTSLGQEYDALALLAGLLLCETKGLHKVYGLGECRGAAAWIMALTMLSEPESYTDWWKQLNVIRNGVLDLQKIKATKQMVQNGIIYMGYPLLDLNAYFNWYDTQSKRGRKDLFDTSIKFNKNNIPAYVLLKKLVESNNFNIVIDFSPNDVVVENKYDKLFDDLQNKHTKLKVIYKSKNHGDRATMLNEALKVYLKDLGIKKKSEKSREKLIDLVHALSQEQPKTLQLLAEDVNCTREKKYLMYAEDCKRLSKYNGLIKQHDTSKTLRIMSYNVHFWLEGEESYWWSESEKIWKRTAYGSVSSNVDNVLGAIKTTNPDIVCLQEVNWGKYKWNKYDTKELIQKFRDMGYAYGGDTTLSPGKYSKWDNDVIPFGTIIFSKYPLENIINTTFEKPDIDDKQSKGERRTFVGVTIQHNNQQIRIYNTHLDVWDDSGKTRESEVAELLEHIKNKDADIDNVIIVGDFNETRARDYQCSINNKNAWDLIKEDDAKRKFPTPTYVEDGFEKAGYTDAYTVLPKKRPILTSWTGKIIDFGYLKPNGMAYFEDVNTYYDKCSDHTPIIFDIAFKIKETNKDN